MHIELWENVSQCITSWQCRVGRRLIAFIFLILRCDMIQGIFCFDCDVVAFWQQDKNSNKIVWQQQCATTPQCVVASVCFSFLPVMPWGFGSLFFACNIVVGFLDHCFATLLSIFTLQHQPFFVLGTHCWFFWATNVLQGEINNQCVHWLG